MERKKDKIINEDGQDKITPKCEAEQQAIVDIINDHYKTMQDFHMDRLKFFGPFVLIVLGIWVISVLIQIVFLS